ncbi:FAD-dependent monooxygenase [Calidifontibacillus erzurumensis]|uniref:FAD-dependent monooxygenase n=1 Tax=Calidifontibacillus erzurumensis TaxID=2741433 RepID=A0A8J8GGF9_9BACI|nr:FAD-dependent monooxygenase [Calidifontibacillus erzurumensis]NSL52947.1 FAD-dependent monooxygenase [Calidifontibacillus erzurumensis]
MERHQLMIVGGGIGGLATALAANEAGIRSTVFEQAPQLGEVGAGLQIGPNGMAVLDRFGVLDEINKVAVFPKRLVLKDIYTAKEVAALDLGEKFQQRYGYPYIVLHRSDLHSILLEACKKTGNVELKTDQRIQTAEQTDMGVVITNEKGEKFVGDAVVGADGIKSNIRKLLSVDDTVPSEYVAYRGTVPIEEVKGEANFDDVIMWIGPNLHLVQYPVRSGKLYNIVVVFKSYNYQEGADWGTPEEMERRFKGAHEEAQSMLRFIQRQFKWPMYDRNPIPNWTIGNITLLGDAAHPMLQYLAQGGVQALEDASYLADMLKKYPGQYNKAFLEYQAERQPRSARVQTSARKWGEVIHAEDQAAILLRDYVFANRTPFDYEVCDWIYGGHKVPMKK